MTKFTADTPLGREVQTILLANPEGLPLHEIRRKLRREKGQYVSEANLQELLRFNPRIFTLHADGRYTLGLKLPATNHKSTQIATSDDDLDPWAAPLLVNLPLTVHNAYYSNGVMPSFLRRSATGINRYAS